MSRLQLLVTQYREDEKIIKHLLDSIESQINIDLKNDIEVFIGNDGSDIKLSRQFLEKYSFPIQYHFFKHSRLAGCRKNLFNISTAEYVMFCDGDDMFLSNNALSLIFNEMKKPFDCLNCAFYREIKNKDGSIDYKLYTNDDCHVHGFVLRRNFLKQNRIEWHQELHEHQDCPYVALVKILAKERRTLDVPVYMWKYYPDSITNRDGELHMPITFVHYIDTFDALITDLKDRGLGEHAKLYAVQCLYITYYRLTRAVWYKPEAEQYRLDVYKRLAEFYKKYELLYVYSSDKLFEEREKAVVEELDKTKKSVILPPIEEWLQSILILFSK